MLSFSTLILAAGKGTRMKSPLPKVIHKACGQSLLAYVLRAAQEAGASRHYVVVGHGREAVSSELERLGLPTEEVFQAEQKGTGHAAQMALPQLKEESTVVILNGDGPLLRPETLRDFLEAHKSKKADLTLGVFTAEDPFGYGRVVLGAGGKLKKIVEEKEASTKEKKIRVVNGGLYAVSAKLLRELLPKLKPSAKTGELYLTDIVALAAAKKKKAFAAMVPAEELLGVNDFSQLAAAEKVLRARKLSAWQREGVRLLDPGSVFADEGVSCAAGVVIGPGVTLSGATSIGTGAVIEAGCVLKDARIDANAEIKAYSYLEGAVVGEGAHVGPFARLRPGTEIGPDCKIGNFVETKKARFAKASKASHLSYIGDAEIGENVNLGCGFITCNYDGINKHKTIVKDEAFVGSDVQAVAPVEIGKGAYVASGTTVTRNVPDGALAVGRARQENKEGYAERIRRRKGAKSP